MQLDSPDFGKPLKMAVRESHPHKKSSRTNSRSLSTSEAFSHYDFLPQLQRRHMTFLGLSTQSKQIALNHKCRRNTKKYNQFEKVTEWWTIMNNDLNNSDNTGRAPSIHYDTRFDDKIIHRQHQYGIC